jgi:hypothetical protein
VRRGRLWLRPVLAVEWGSKDRHRKVRCRAGPSTSPWLSRVPHRSSGLASAALVNVSRLTPRPWL